MPLKQITGETIEQYVKHRSREIERRSLSDEVCSLRSFMGYCFNRRLVAKLPEGVFDRPVSFDVEMPPRALDWPLVRQFLKSVDRSNRAGWRDSMVLHLMAYYGLRPGETTKLRVDSIDWTAQTLLVEQPKTHSWLTLPLMDRTVKLLRRYLQDGRHKSKHPMLFSKVLAPYGPMTCTNVSWIFRTHARKSGLPITNASAYALRHSFAMRLFARGVGIKAIGDLMGHNSLRSTTVYLRLQTDMLREVALPVPTMAMLRGGVK
jgi:site-specific recombinase XerD